MNCRTLTVRFTTRLTHHDVPLLRGAVIAALNDDAPLFHNHGQGTALHYVYPKVQYKCLDGRAALVCINEGADAAETLFTTGQHFDVKLGTREAALDVESIEARQWQVRVCDQAFDYRVRRWLPLNESNYRAWQDTASLAERLALLERVLRGNILSLAKGLGVHLDGRVSAAITDISRPRWTRVKGVSVMMLDVGITTNVALPLQVGLGKHASLGHGTVNS